MSESNPSLKRPRVVPSGGALPLGRRVGGRFKELGLMLVIAILIAVLTGYGWYDASGRAGGRGPGNMFFNTDNLVDGLATPMAYYAIMAAGMTVVIITGGIDISVASNMALAGLVTAWSLQRLEVAGASGAAVWAVSLIMPLAVGLACGLVNGGLIVGLRMHPFIVTLGTLSIFRGLCNVIPFGAQTLNVPATYLEGAGGGMTALLQKSYFMSAGGGVQLWPLILMLLTAAVAWVFLSATVWGRQTYAVGGNEEAARFSGIPVGRVKLTVYAISGLTGGLAGLVSLGRFGTVSTNTGNGYELSVVAAAVVGGASLTGGRGTALGALLGTLVLALIENAISILHLNEEYKRIIVGLAIIVAVAMDRLFDFLRQRRSILGR